MAKRPLSKAKPSRKFIFVSSSVRSTSLLSRPRLWVETAVFQAASEMPGDLEVFRIADHQGQDVGHTLVEARIGAW